MVDMVGSLELMERQIDWQQNKCHWWLIESLIILSVEELEQSETTNTGHDTADYLVEDRRRKRHWLVIYKVRPTGTSVNQISVLFPLESQRHSGRWSRAHVDFSEHLDSVLNGKELLDTHYAVLLERDFLHKHDHLNFTATPVVTFPNRVILTEDRNLACNMTS